MPTKYREFYLGNLTITVWLYEYSKLNESFIIDVYEGTNHLGSVSDENYLSALGLVAERFILDTIKEQK